MIFRRKLLRTGVSVAILGWSCGSLLACSSDEDKGEGGKTVGGVNDIDLEGGSGDPNTSIADSDGGTEELSEKQVAALQNASCAGWSAEGENLPGALQLVVDASSSMNNQAPGSQRSKWEVTRDALVSAIDELPASIAVGMLHYPNLQTQHNGPCVNQDELISIGPLAENGSEQRGLLRSSLENVELNRGTPTFEAYKHALNESLVPNKRRNRFMLLITDGAPTIGVGCDFGNENGNLNDAPTQPIVDLIRAAREEHDILTFLIGSPGSEQSAGGNRDNGDMRPWLSRAAVQGGTELPGCSVDGPNFCHMDMTEDADFASSLRAGLTAVIGQIVDSCTFAIPTPPTNQSFDVNKTNLVITWEDGSSTLVKPDGKGDCDEGWQFNDGGDIVLCEDTCTRLKEDRRARVGLNFGCSVDEVIGTTQ